MNDMCNFQKNKFFRRISVFICILSVSLFINFFLCVNVLAINNEDPYNESSYSNSKAEPVENSNSSYTTNNGVREENGSLYYYIDGLKQYNKWIPKGKLWYYAQPNGILYRNTIVRIGSDDYAFDDNGVMYSGNFRFNQNAYITDQDGHIQKSGWKKYNGKWYYAQQNGALYSDAVRTIGNSKFGFDYYGVMYSNLFGYSGKFYLPDEDGYIWNSGWKYRDGTWFYARRDGSLYTKGVYTIDGEKYAFSNDGKMHVNEFSVGNKHYLADSSGAIYKAGWKYTGNYWYYITRDGELASDGVHKIDGEYYCFDDNGRMYKNKFSHRGKQYLADSSGALYINKWTKKNGKWYYSQGNGSLFSDGVYTVDNEDFAFYHDGAMCEGAFSLNNKRYLADDRGVVQKNGWKTIKNKKYYAQSNGELFANRIIKIGNNYYGFDYSGVLQTNEFELNGNKYLAYENGQLHIAAWLNYKGHWYYARSDGRLYFGGFYDIKDEKFAFDSNGKMFDGEFAYKNKHYVTNERGDVQRNGWNKVKNIWYYATPDYSLHVSTIKNINGEDYGFDKNGRMYEGIFVLNDKHYITSSSGAILKGGWREYGSGDWVLPDSQGILLVNKWYKYQNKDYYAKSNGIFARNESLTIDGKTYYFDSSCACISKQEYDAMKANQAGALNVARREVGTKVGEKYWNRTFNGSPRYVNGDVTPWCACFVNWCFVEAGQGSKLSGLGNKAYVPSYVNWGKKNGTWKNTPKPGDLVVFRWYSGSNGSHIGFVESVNGNSITTIEGNTGSSYHGEVKRNYFNINSSYIYGYIRL